MVAKWHVEIQEAQRLVKKNEIPNYGKSKDYGSDMSGVEVLSLTVIYD